MPGCDVACVREDRDDLLAAFVAVRSETDAEVNPGDPAPPTEEVRAELFVGWRRQQRVAWVATVDGEPVGELTAVLEDEPNQHLVEVESLAVVPRHRRRGVADALLSRALGSAELGGRDGLTFWVPVLPDGAGLRYVQRLGATQRLVERCSRAEVASLPWDVVDGWRDEGRRRTDGYRLVRCAGDVPDEHVPLLTSVRRAMQDQPTGDLDRAVPDLDEDDVRSYGAAATAQGYLPVITFAVAPDGSPAGFSALFVSRHRPEIGHQGDTGVLAGHRGRGLGRWLKAENLHEALAFEPRLRVVETYNAESNPWMLDINVAMGFRLHRQFEAWASPADRVREAIRA